MQKAINQKNGLTARVVETVPRWWFFLSLICASFLAGKSQAPPPKVVEVERIVKHVEPDPRIPWLLAQFRTYRIQSGDQYLPDGNWEKLPQKIRAKYVRAKMINRVLEGGPTDKWADMLEELGIEDYRPAIVSAEDKRPDR